MTDRAIAVKCQKLISQNLVTIFSKSSCPFCSKVKILFESLNITPVVYEIDLEQDGQEVQKYLYELTGQRTVPNVFVLTKHIGGCDDTMKAHENGSLELILRETHLKTPKEKVQALLQKHTVLVFSTSTCEDSTKVQALFNNMGVEPKMFHLDKELDGLIIQEYLHKTSGRTSTPNVYVRGKPLGGYDDTSKAFHTGLINNSFE